MAIIIVDKTKRIVGIFGREAEGIGKCKVSEGKNHFAEWGVFEVGVDGAIGGGDKFGDVLVAINGI